MLELQPKYSQLITRIAHTYAPDCQVRIFGSRVRGTARRYSDADLALIGPKPLSLDQLMHLKEAFENSELPFRVDVVDWQRASPAFKASVEAQGMVTL